MLEVNIFPAGRNDSPKECLPTHCTWTRSDALDGRTIRDCGDDVMTVKEINIFSDTWIHRLLGRCLSEGVAFLPSQSSDDDLKPKVFSANPLANCDRVDVKWFPNFEVGLQKQKFDGVSSSSRKLLPKEEIPRAPRVVEFSNLLCGNYSSWGWDE